MIYLLDTNTCIRFLNRRHSPVKDRLAARSPADIRLCSMVKAELYCGAYRSARRDENLALLEEFFARVISLPFDDRAASVSGQIRAALSLTGQLIGPNDLVIAAIALVNEVTLVTHNVGEFGHVPGLIMEDWEVPL